ncbi:hypothetical protein CI105_09335 [Candidatus Izimaplasma bacterium ZiA1]|nr:hypothetical protein CI105_09335 [Candidatus Izimaplasma bacterium ZiA1]
MFMGGEAEHSKLLDLENDIKLFNLKLIELSENNISLDNNLTYAITIGSSEKDDYKPCLSLYNRFINSADAKDFLDVNAYFEKGKKGYIHIHASITKSRKFSMSKAKLGQRYGKYKGKQCNFDVKRLIGLDIVKWKQYIKKDSQNSWNLIVNKHLKNAEEASILSDATELAM